MKRKSGEFDEKEEDPTLKKPFQVRTASFGLLVLQSNIINFCEHNGVLNNEPNTTIIYCN